MSITPLKDAFNQQSILFYTKPKKRDGSLHGLYVNLVVDLIKFDTDHYYYIDESGNRCNVKLTMKDNGKLMDFNLISRKFYVTLNN